MKETYSALNLIKDIKKELENLISLKKVRKISLTAKKISEILNDSTNLVYQIRKNSKRNQNFQLTLDELKKFKSNLKIKIGKDVENVFRFIKRYQNLNKIRKSKDHFYYHHRNINFDYF